MKALQYITGLTNRGEWSFSEAEARWALGVNPKDALALARRAGRILSPARGFYVIVPEEMSLSLRVPAERYIHQLMAYWDVPYYVGLLTAAFFHGSAHQSPQIFQVVTYPARRSTIAGQDKITFYRRHGLEDTPTEMRKNATGYFKLSTPEATVFDLIQFNRRIGGLSHVALVLSELAEQITPEGLLDAVKDRKAPTVQRAGYLLEKVGHRDGAAVLQEWVTENYPSYTPLNPSAAPSTGERFSRWRLLVNQDVAVET